MLHAPAVTTIASPITRPSLVSTPTTRSPEKTSRSTVTPSRMVAPSACAPRASASTTVDVTICASSGGVARAEHVLADRWHEPPNLGAVDERHVEPVRPAFGHEFLEQRALFRGREVHQCAAWPEFEPAGQVREQLRVQLPAGARDVEGKPAGAGMEQYEPRVSPGRSVADPLRFEERDVHALTGAEVRGRAADDAATDDDDAAHQLGRSTTRHISSVGRPCWPGRPPRSPRSTYLRRTRHPSTPTPRDSPHRRSRS